MSNQYDRVSYPDKVKFASDMEEEDGVGHRTGNGIYNDYTVQLAPKQYSEDFKIACFTFQKTRRTAFILCGVLVVLVMVVLIIIIAASSHTSKQNPPVKSYGLLAYPTAQDGSSLISFSPLLYTSYQQYTDNLDFHMNDYDVIKQEANLDKYVKCSDNMTAESLSPGQVCMQTPITFGQFCQNMNLYGYDAEMPCVMLVLKLQEGSKPEPFDFNDETNKELKAMLGDLATKTSVPITCKGKTEEDQTKMMVTIAGGNTTKAEMDYNPKMGFPLYFFPLKSGSDYISPAVMVQFKSLQMNTDITVRCTAWARNFNNGKPQDPDSAYSTEFTFRISTRH